ncbi:uncharacterized protein LOC143783337 [Ranitomeya variabilis]|uniref:uncharacterized protein LOC143783337 n=1 Tax=Ranitomeya variabilis TaxID=490064 RepID=UPI0040578C35
MTYQKLDNKISTRIYADSITLSKMSNKAAAIFNATHSHARIISISLPSQTKDTVNLVIQNVFRLHGVTDEIISDRGVQFTSRFWKGFCSALNINVCLSSAYHPQTNGQTERTNQTLEQYLRCYVSHLQDDGLELLPLAEFSYNNSQSASTKFTPFFANLGYHPCILPRSLINSPVPAVEERLTAMRQNLEVLKESLTTAKERYKRSADRFCKPAPMFKGRVGPPPQPVVIDGQEQFVVEEIVDSRIRRNRLQYLIRWQGYPPEEDSWEPVENINAQQKISYFHQRFPEKPGPGSS